jgi:hypothetical protein
MVVEASLVRGRDSRPHLGRAAQCTIPDHRLRLLHKHRKERSGSHPLGFVAQSLGPSFRLLLQRVLKHSTRLHAIIAKHACGTRRATSLTAVSGPKLRFSEIRDDLLPQPPDRLQYLDQHPDHAHGAVQPCRVREAGPAITARSPLVRHYDEPRTSSVSGWRVSCVSRTKDRCGQVSWPWPPWPGLLGFSISR